jgi:hypothetical protein
MTVNLASCLNLILVLARYTKNMTDHLLYYTITTMNGGWLQPDVLMA